MWMGGGGGGRTRRKFKALKEKEITVCQMANHVCPVLLSLVIEGRGGQPPSSHGVGRTRSVCGRLGR